MEGNPTGSYEGDGGTEGNSYGPRENGANDGLAEVNEIGEVEGNLIGPYEEGDAEYDWPLG